mmetsp:Transcript_13340/g.27421  ORF Transcript_13340/g.27421 Transcript_13340/m.27421 type:complete len:85 (-) Transcript_13340:633-887(-)
MHLGTGSSTTLSAASSITSPYLPSLANLKAASSSNDMKFTAVKFRTISVTSDEVMTKRNTAMTAKRPCIERRMQENATPHTLSF